MNLFKVYVKHYSPKDSHESVEGFLIRNSADEVLDYVAKTLGFMDDYELEEEVEDDDLGDVTLRERLLHYCGALFDPNSEVSDLYYGAKQFGWKDFGPASAEEIALLRRLELILE